MFAMGTFVVMIVAKQPEIAQMCDDPGIDYPFINENNSALIKFNHNISTECEVKLINLSSDSIFSAGILIFAYMSHCNVLAIFAEVKTRSLERMQKGRNISVVLSLELGIEKMGRIFLLIVV